MAERDIRKTIIGVTGASHTEKCGLRALDEAKQLGKSIVEAGAVLLIPSKSGFPLWVSMGVEEAGGTTIALSPAKDELEHDTLQLPKDFISVLLYTGLGESGRDILLSRMSDGLVVGCGNAGSLREASIAMTEGSLVGVLKGDWHTDEEITALLTESPESYKDKIFFEESVEELVTHLLKRIHDK